jgi:hypothetical protein
MPLLRYLDTDDIILPANYPKTISLPVEHVDSSGVSIKLGGALPPLSAATCRSLKDKFGVANIINSRNLFYHTS